MVSSCNDRQGRTIAVSATEWAAGNKEGLGERLVTRPFDDSGTHTLWRIEMSAGRILLKLNAMV